MARCEVLLQHSVTAQNGNTEGLPTSILEAFGARMAVISTRHAGIPEAVVDNQNGLLVDEHDEDGFARCILTLLNDPPLAQQFGENGHKLAVEKFDTRLLLARLEARLADWTKPQK